MANKNIAILGLPATGKSTYIAALWTLMISKSKYCSLILNSLREGNQEYLNKLGIDWATYQDLGRTIFTNVGEVVMDLKSVNNGEIMTLNIPDYYGEIFDSHFQNREWSEEYAQLIENSDGFILFVDSASQNNISRTIMSEIENMEPFEGIEILHANCVEDSVKKEAEISPTDVGPTTSYKHSSSSNQVKIVDTLQFIMLARDNKPIKLSVVVSAWDIVTDLYGQILPQKIIEAKMPLLAQFIDCNSETLQSRYFGVSAQGGSYKEESVELYEKLPEDRVIVFDGKIISKDITLPILWLAE